MNNLTKVPSIVQIFFAEFLCVLFLSPFVMALWNTIRPGTFGDTSLRDKSDWVWFLLGFALFVWSLREILRPRLKGDSWVSFKTGASSGGSYAFCSTHPSYIFVDLIMVTVTAFFLWIGLTEKVDSKQFAVMFAIALIFPTLRLFAWYVLGLRIEDEEETKHAWKAVAWVAIPFFGVFALIAVLVFIEDIKHKREVANLPVVDEQSFANSREAFARLMDTSQTERVTGFVRLRAKQISDEPEQCKNPENFDWASVLADLGAGGDVLIVGARYAGSGFDDLISKSGGKKGSQIEVIGKLREVPAPGAIAKWKAYCGLRKLPPPPAGGRWVLEIGQP